MDCEAFENYLLNCQDGEFPASQRSEVEAHLALCSGCRELLHQFQRLDKALERQIQPVALPMDFEQKLHQRLHAKTPALSPEQLAERKRQIQEEFEEGLAHLRRWSLPPNWLEKWGTLALLAAMASWLVCHALTHLPNLPGLSAAGVAPQNLLYSLAGAGIFSAIGLAVAFYRPLRQS